MSGSEKDTGAAVWSGTYVISLPWETERRRHVSGLLNAARIPFEFIDGIEVEPEQVRYVEMREMDCYGGRWEYLRDAGYIARAVGCRRSHEAALTRILHRGWSAGLVLEDDVAFEPDWLARLSRALRDLPAGWHQLYLGGDVRGPVVPIAGSLAKIGRIWRTHAVLYSQAGARAGLEALRLHAAEVDVALWKGVQGLGHSYAMIPAAATQGSFKSAINSRG